MQHFALSHVRICLSTTNYPSDSDWLAENSLGIYFELVTFKTYFTTIFRLRVSFFSVGSLALSFSILLRIASQCFLTNYLWIPIHNAFLGDSSQLDSHREMDALVYRLVIFTRKVPVLAWTAREIEWWPNKLELRLGKNLCKNLDLTDARYYCRLWYFFHNILRGIE